MGNPIISVIMSVYNTNEAWLRSSIESILYQTYNEFEFIIVLDSPTDNSKEIVMEYQKIDDRIIVIENKNNLGITKSLNKGLSIAKGMYIARMDSDDISVKDRLEKQLKFMKKNHEISVVGSYVVEFGNGKLLPGNSKCRKDFEEERVRLLFGNAGIPHPTAFIRKSFLDNNNLKYNESYPKSQDYKLWVDIINYGGKIYQLTDILLLYRSSSIQVSKINKSEQLLLHDKIMHDQIMELFNPTDKEIRIHTDLAHAKNSFKTSDYISYLKKLKEINGKKNMYNTKVFNDVTSAMWLRYIIYRCSQGQSLSEFIDRFTLKSFFNFKAMNFILLYYIKRINYKLNIKIISEKLSTSYNLN